MQGSKARGSKARNTRLEGSRLEDSTYRILFVSNCPKYVSLSTCLNSTSSAEILKSFLFAYMLPIIFVFTLLSFIPSSLSCINQ